MNYMKETDAWLDELLVDLLDGPEDDETDEAQIQRIKKAIKDKILESYHNGQKAALRAAAVSWPAEARKKLGSIGANHAMVEATTRSLGWCSTQRARRWRPADRLCSNGFPGRTAGLPLLMEQNGVRIQSSSDVGSGFRLN